MSTQPNPQSLTSSGSWFRGISWASLRSNGFIRNVGIICSGSALGNLFTFAAGPLLTRIYSPAEFGALGLFTSLLSILGVAGTLQYETSIVNGKDEEEAAHLVIGALLITVPSSLVAGGILWFLIDESVLGFGSLPGFAPVLMTLSVALIAWFATLRYWALRGGQFHWIAQASVLQSSTRAVLQTVLGITGFHLSGLLLGETLGRSMGISRTLRGSWPVLKGYARCLQWRQLASTLSRYRKFPLYSFPSTILDAVCLGMPMPLLVRMYGVSFGGQYSLVWKAITVPSVLISMSVADTFHTTLAQCVRETPERAMHLFRTTTLSLLLIGSAPSILLAVCGPSMFAWIFGSRWALAGSIAAFVVPWYLAQFVASPLSRAVAVLSGQESKLVWDVVCLLSLCAVFLAARIGSFPPMLTIKVLSVVNALLYVAYYLVLYRIVAKFDRSRSAALQSI